MIRATAILVLLAACSAPAATRSTHTIEGRFQLVQSERVAVETSGDTVTSCRGTGGYSDVREGLQVVVRDGAGTTLGTATLELHPSDPMPDIHSCWYAFTVPGLPETEFYAIEVGDRGELTYSFDELEEMDWRVSTLLGE